VADKLASTSGKAPLSLAAFISGVVGILVFFVGGPMFDLWVFGALIGAVAAILGFMARKRESTGKGLATAGLVLGVIVVAWFVVFIILAATGVITEDA
jgi:hypothetical protein